MRMTPTLTGFVRQSTEMNGSLAASTSRHTKNKCILVAYKCQDIRPAGPNWLETPVNRATFGSHVGSPTRTGSVCGMEKALFRVRNMNRALSKREPSVSHGGRFNMEMMEMEAATEALAGVVDGDVEHAVEQAQLHEEDMDTSNEWAKQADEETASFPHEGLESDASSWPPQADLAFNTSSDGVDDQGVVGESAGGGESTDEAQGVWVAQYDPSAKRVYYYNTLSGDATWDEPAGFVDGAYQDEKMAGAVKIQSVFRSKKARDRVKTMAEDGDPEAETIGAEGDDPGDVSAMSEDPGLPHELVANTGVWKQHYDPRSQQYYYHNVETGESTWEKPPGDEGVFTDKDPEGDSVVKIQCAFRKRVASKSVETKKQVVRDLTSSEVITQKLKELMKAVDEIQAEVEARKRTLSGAVSTKQAHLHESVASWSVSVAYIRDRVLDHHHHARLVQQMESTGADKLATAQQFHDALAATRSECVALLKSVLVTDSSFLDVDIARLNEAFERFTHYQKDDLFSISEAKVRNVIRVDELQSALAVAESSMRSAMGMTDFNAGAATKMGKIYGESREDVEKAMQSISQLGKVIGHKRDLLALYQHSLGESKEISEMQREDELSWVCERAARKQEAARLAHFRFLEKCRQSWLKGLEIRHEDNQAIEDEARTREMKRQSDKERIARMVTADMERRSRVKLSIWEAVKEGYAVEVIRTMVQAEVQKAHQNGFEFVIRAARSDRGETLVQIACWAGHTELVEYFLDEGADLHAVDNVYNRFNLLHDASRRGYAQIIRLLVGRGLQQDIVDASGDTPLHWAVRKNHYEAVHTLLGAYMPRHDPEHNECALRAVRTKNSRSRTPIQLAKSESLRRLLQAFEEGRIRLPQQISRGGNSSGNSPRHNQSRRKSGQGMSRSSSVRSLTGNDAKEHHHGLLVKAATETTHHHGQNHTHGHEEDEFGSITVLTAR